jgi:membrane-bound lytic murein transglycosylase B
MPLSRAFPFLVAGVCLALSATAWGGEGSAAQVPRSRWTAEHNRRVELFRRELVGHRLLKADPVAGAEASFALWDPRLVLDPSVIASFERNPEKDARRQIITYREYRRRLGLDGKIAAAPAFYDRNRGALEATEREFGVSRYLLAAVLGVETDFGAVRQVGSRRAADVFLSLYVLSETPRLRRFAVNEMANLLVLSRRLQVGLFDIRSSYAGAIGYPQGIPSSLNRFYQGDLGSMEDSIDFVGRYLATEGATDGGKPRKLDSPRNRKAIYSFNHSDHYVKAVLEIAQALAAKDRGRGTLLLY